MQTELDSFLIEISALILAFKDEDGQPLVNKILDKTGMKGTGMRTPDRNLLKGSGNANQPASHTIASGILPQLLSLTALAALEDLARRRQSHALLSPDAACQSS